MIAIKDGTFTENKPTLSTILHHAFGHVKAEIIPTKIPTDMKMNVLDNIATIYFIKSTRLFSYPFYQGVRPAFPSFFTRSCYHYVNQYLRAKKSTRRAKSPIGTTVKLNSTPSIE